MTSLIIVPLDSARDHECNIIDADTFLIVRDGAEMMRVSSYERAQRWIATHPDGEPDDD